MLLTSIYNGEKASVIIYKKKRRVSACAPLFTVCLAIACFGHRSTLADRTWTGKYEFLEIIFLRDVDCKVTVMSCNIRYDEWNVERRHWTLYLRP